MLKTIFSYVNHTKKNPHNFRQIRTEVEQAHSQVEEMSSDTHKGEPRKNIHGQEMLGKKWYLYLSI